MNRILIAGTNSGCGKTTVVCALLRALVKHGNKTVSFKCGPDYIDPMFHSRIIGTHSRNLDSYFLDENTLRYLLARNSEGMDISVIEGVMGYYDGASDGKGSSYETAVITKTPAVIVINAKGMSDSAGAVMKGFMSYKEDSRIKGFIFNGLSPRLAEKMKKLCGELGTEFLGFMPNIPECAIESRHLGLVTADEIADLGTKLDKLAETAEKYIDINRIKEISASAEPLSYEPVIIKKADIRLRIAAAIDSAFCFYYEDSFELLRDMGCEIIPFSPLSDSYLPDDTDGLIIGGGYPELYADRLSDNASMREGIKAAAMNSIPLIAECGGFMYLCRSLEDMNGKRHEMCGVFPSDAFRTPKLCRFGYTALTAVNDNMLCNKGGMIRSHEFHKWDCTDCGDGFIAEKISNGTKAPACFADMHTYAGYPHLQLWSCPEAAYRFVRACEEYKGKRK